MFCVFVVYFVSGKKYILMSHCLGSEVLDHAGADRGGYDRRPLGSPYYREGGRAQFDPYSRPIPKQSFGDFKPPIVKTELCRDWARFNGDCPRGAGFVSL